MSWRFRARVVGTTVSKTMSPGTVAAFKVLALGPNPALQRVLTFDSPLALGGVNRASALSQYVGGKGQGVALAVQHWAPGGSACAQFVGGDNGRFVEAELHARGVDAVCQHTAAATRICTTLIGEGGSTELIDPTGGVSDAELQGLLDQLDGRLDEYGAIALCGTTPPGASELYRLFCERVASRPQLLLLDGYKGVDAVLGSGRVDVLKLNVDEVKALTKTESVDAAARALLHEPGAPLRRPGAMLALTDGASPAWLFSRAGAWRLTVPSIQCVNAIGAGDVCTGVFLHSLARAAAEPRDGAPAVGAEAAVDAFAWGLAAACARCGHEQPVFERSEVEALRARIAIEALHTDHR